MIHDVARAAVVNRDREIAVARRAGELLSSQTSADARHVLGMLTHSSAERAKWWDERVPDGAYIASSPIDTSDDTVITTVKAATTLEEMMRILQSMVSSYRIHFESVDEVLDAPTARTLMLCMVDAGRDADTLSRVA